MMMSKILIVNKNNKHTFNYEVKILQVNLINSELKILLQVLASLHLNPSLTNDAVGLGKISFPVQPPH